MGQQEVDEMRRIVQDLRSQCTRQAETITMLERKLMFLLSCGGNKQKESSSRQQAQN